MVEEKTHKKEKPAMEEGNTVEGNQSSSRTLRLQEIVVQELSRRLADNLADNFVVGDIIEDVKGTSRSCNGNCAGECTGSCRGTCDGCKGDCAGSCSGDCAGDVKAKNDQFEQGDILTQNLVGVMTPVMNAYRRILIRQGFPR